MLKQPLQKNVQVVVPVIVSVGRFGRVLFKTNKNESSKKDSYPSPCRLSKRRVDVPTADFVKPSIYPSRKIKYLILNYAHESVDTVAIYDALFFFIRPVFNVSSV